MEQQLTFFLALALGLVFGGLAAWLMLRTETNAAYARAKTETLAEQKALAERLSGKEARVEDLTQERDQLRAEVQRLREETADLKALNAELETRVDEMAKSSDERMSVVREAREQLAEAFRDVSQEALESNNQAFLDLARQVLAQPTGAVAADGEGRQRAMAELITPLRESLERVGVSIQELERSREAAYAGISEQVRELVSAQQQLRNETAQLVNALRSPTARGRWGELQLRRVAELAGMLPYCEFRQQGSSEDGAPAADMIVRLPNRRLLAVDTKVPLEAYLEALDASEEQERAARLEEHAARLRAHVDALAAKSYTDSFETTPEFVIAFVPGEAFFAAALEQDPGLLEYGVERNVIVAPPTTLIALLRAVVNGWRHETVAWNAEEVASLGRSLYTRLRAFMRHFENIRQDLERTVKGYNRAAGTLESQVLESARRFKDLGVPAKGEISAPHPVDAFPRSLAAIEKAVSAEAREEQQLLDESAAVQEASGSSEATVSEQLPAAQPDAPSISYSSFVKTS